MDKDASIAFLLFQTSQAIGASEEENFCMNIFSPQSLMRRPQELLKSLKKIDL